MEINLSNYDNKDIIKILREWTELTQKEFAESIGLKERTIRSYEAGDTIYNICLLYTSPSPRDRQKSRMPSSA